MHTNAPSRILQTWLPPAINPIQTCAFQTRIGTTTKPMPFNAHTLTTCCAKSRVTRHLFYEFSQHYEPNPPKMHSKHIALHFSANLNPHSERNSNNNKHVWFFIVYHPTNRNCYGSELLRFDRGLDIDLGGNSALNAARFFACLTFFRVRRPLITFCSLVAAACGLSTSSVCSSVRNKFARQLIHSVWLKLIRLLCLYFSCSSGCTGHDHNSLFPSALVITVL